MDLFGFKLDLWTLFGFAGQFIFFMRFIVQWIASERAKRSVIPVSFWHISILGSVMLGIYAWQRKDLVFGSGTVLSLIIYFRNLHLLKKEAAQSASTNPS